MKELLLSFINYELKCKNIDFIFKNEHLTSTINVSEIDDEIFYSINIYYRFMNELSQLEVFSNIYYKVFDIFKNSSNFTDNEELNIIKKNNIFILSVWLFYNKNLEFFTLFHTILIFKSLTSKLLSSKLDDYDINEYENSDIIISTSVDLFEKFIVYYEIGFSIDSQYLNRQLRSYFFSLYEYLTIVGVLESHIKWIGSDVKSDIRSIKF
jgi:hypothetical protein